MLPAVKAACAKVSTEVSTTHVPVLTHTLVLTHTYLREGEHPARHPARQRLEARRGKRVRPVRRTYGVPYDAFAQGPTQQGIIDSGVGYRPVVSAAGVTR